MKAIWNGEVIAESDKIIELEGKVYFPPESVKKEYLHKNGDTYVCSWKGVCDYYDVTVDDKTAEGAAFIYPEPEEAAKEIAGWVVFWREMEVKE